MFFTNKTLASFTKISGCVVKIAKDFFSSAPFFVYLLLSLFSFLLSFSLFFSFTFVLFFSLSFMLFILFHFCVVFLSKSSLSFATVSRQKENNSRALDWLKDQIRMYVLGSSQCLYLTIRRHFQLRDLFMSSFVFLPHTI